MDKCRLIMNNFNSNMSLVLNFNIIKIPIGSEKFSICFILFFAIIVFAIRSYTSRSAGSLSF